MSTYKIYNSPSFGQGLEVKTKEGTCVLKPYLCYCITIIVLIL